MFNVSTSKFVALMFGFDQRVASKCEGTSANGAHAASQCNVKIRNDFNDPNVASKLAPNCNRIFVLTFTPYLRNCMQIFQRKIVLNPTNHMMWL